MIAIGGFNGTDPTPTLAEFQQYVGRGAVHFFLAGGSRGPGIGVGSTGATATEGSAITAWVRATSVPARLAV